MAIITSDSSVHSFGPKPAYYLTPIEKEITYGIISEGISKTWDFRFKHILHIDKDVFHLDKLTLLAPTYIETSVKINHLKGDTLIISNSSNIGNVHAKTVVLNHSQADNVTGENVYLFYSKVRDTVHVKNLVLVVRPILGIESLLPMKL